MDDEKKIQVRFSDEESCVTSQVSWANPEVMKALRDLFMVSKNDKIVAIKLTPWGIHASFARKK